MPRRNGNKEKQDDLKKIELTLGNIHQHEDFLAENAEELTAHQVKDIKKHLAAKKKFLTEVDGTIK